MSKVDIIHAQSIIDFLLNCRQKKVSSSQLPHQLNHCMYAGAQTIMSNISEPKQTAGRLGLLNFSYGVGTIFGLMASNWCAENSQYRVSAYIAAFGSLLSFCLVHSFIPSQTEVKFADFFLKFYYIEKYTPVKGITVETFHHTFLKIALKQRRGKKR